ncbi:ACT domain-containing family protein [Striga asiatica]|uniref:ACT domain-containing protein ACR n=1 Tax=Striga asiatica TaxID=4170 RepID=A0A5A7PE15_STRAF|nr:ACT domain-containing family protein [Striga asiatica]
MSCDLSNKEWPPYLDEYEKLVIRMSTPRVIIDNGSGSNETRLMIDSARKHGILLEAVQVLTDLNLSIKKAYICSDGRWFMDVFHVTDLNGNKLTDDSVLGRIQQSLETVHYGQPTRPKGPTALELTGTDRVGLLSEVFAVLTEMNCNVVEAKVWAHNGRVASLIYVKDRHTGCPIEDEDKLDAIGCVIRNVLKGDDIDTIWSAKTSVSCAVTHTERRLHQLMFADRDYDKEASGGPGSCPSVSVRNYLEKDYSVVNVQCRDRNKLLFDVVCALTDMDYVVFHATVDTSEDSASMEFFIRRTDGMPISSEAEKERLILCLQAAIERRSSKGVRLELCAADRNGLLADVTRAFRENGLSIARAEISTSWDMARNVFYVTDAVGNTVDPEIVELVREKVGFEDLKITKTPSECGRKIERESPRMGTGGAVMLSIESMFIDFVERDTVEIKSCCIYALSKRPQTENDLMTMTTGETRIPARGEPRFIFFRASGGIGRALKERPSISSPFDCLNLSPKLPNFFFGRAGATPTLNVVSPLPHWQVD